MKTRVMIGAMCTLASASALTSTLAYADTTEVETTAAVEKISVVGLSLIHISEPTRPY